MHKETIGDALLILVPSGASPVGHDYGFSDRSPKLPAAAGKGAGAHHFKRSIIYVCVIGALA